MQKYLVSLDTETGGIRPDKDSLLEVGLVVTTIEGTPVYSYHADVQPKGGEYIVSPKALEINGINLERHRLVAAPIHEVAQAITEHLLPYREDNGGPLILVGWNVNFDRGFLQHQLLGFEEVARLFGYRTMDLHAVMAFLALNGQMPYTKSLEATAQFFGLLTGDERQQHSAWADAMLTAQVLRSMLKFTKVVI